MGILFLMKSKHLSVIFFLLLLVSAVPCISQVINLPSPVKAKSVPNWFIYKDYELENRLMATSEDELLIVGYQAWVFKVKKNDTIGYISTKGIQKDNITKPLIEMVIDNSERLEEENIKRQEQLEFEKNNAPLIKRFGKTIVKKIADHSYWIGMTKEMAVLSLGPPDENNRTVTANTVTEQWVYNDRYKYSHVYLYFKNGILESFQD